MSLLGSRRTVGEMVGAANSIDARLETRMLLDVRKLDELGFLCAPLTDVSGPDTPAQGSALPMATRCLEE